MTHPDVRGKLAERSIPDGLFYHCLNCERDYLAGSRTVSCLVNHTDASCCHYTDRLVAKPDAPHHFRSISQ